jgi:hypothetical protein
MRSSARWYDSECRDIKRTTCQLEWKYCRLKTVESLVAWRCQFEHLCLLYHSKFASFWSSTINTYKRNPRALWRAVNTMLQPPQQRSSKLSANDFATFFQDKVAIIRASAASATPPDITSRQAPQLRCFEPVTVTEMVKLIKTTPAKSCPLDPIPSWLLRQLITPIAPVLCQLCNLSMQTGNNNNKKRQFLKRRNMAKAITRALTLATH